MALKNEKTYCGNGFPNLPDFKDLSGGGSGGSAAVMAGQAIRISDISVSNVSYKRINASVDDLTIAIDATTNKLKSLVKQVPFETPAGVEVDTGLTDLDGNHIFMKSFHETLTAEDMDESFDILPANTTIVDYDCLIRVFSGAVAGFFVRPNYYITQNDFVTAFIYQGTFHVNHKAYHGGGDAFIKLYYTKNS